MYMKKSIFTLAGLLSAGCLFGQVNILDEALSPTGVSDEGIVAGSFGQTQPYYLWNPANGELREIGGVSAGNGVGGSVKFSADGNYLSGTMYTEMQFPTEWKETVITERDYTFTGIGFPISNLGFAIGKDPQDATKGVMLQTNNNGITWSDIGYKMNGGLESICFLNDNVGLVGGRNALFAYTTTRGTEWKGMNPRPEGNTDEVAAYLAIDFIREEPYAGVVGAELAGGGYAVYQSPDGAESWTVATGVTGIPTDITHVDGAFFMTTRNGHIQKSVDNGLTWTDIFKTEAPLQPITALYKIGFGDKNVGIAAADYVIYRTTNGGKSWKAMIPEDNIPQKTVWKGLYWQDATHVMLVGTGGLAYSSDDAGATWTKMDTGAGAGTELHAVVMSDSVVNICGTHGSFYRKSLRSKATVSQMGRYDVAAGEWTPLGSLGYISDGISSSSGYAISGDGKTVVGLAGTYNRDVTINNNAYAHAVAWTEGKGMTDLGSVYAGINRSTRANAVNYDGSVIVGWQDQRGPWHSAVWRSDDSGAYGPNEFILVDPQAGSELADNRVPQCFAVSQDGQWIGGSGRSINTAPLSVIDDDRLVANQPYIWSEATGLKRLGMISELEGNEAAVGYTSGINNDGTKAVGWIVVGNSMYPFIWTAAGGIENLNDYIRNTWKDALSDEYMICSVLCMSPGGRYITGWGIANNTSLFAFTADLQAASSIATPKQAKQEWKVYPNPATDVLHIDLPADAAGTIDLYDAQGRKVLGRNAACGESSLPLDGVEAGFYFLKVATDGMQRTYKVEVAR